MSNFTKCNNMCVSDATCAADNSARSFNIVILMGISLLVSIFAAVSNDIIIILPILFSLILGVIVVLLIVEKFSPPHMERTDLV